MEYICSYVSFPYNLPSKIEFWFQIKMKGEKTHAKSVNLAHSHHTPYMTDGGVRVHFGIPTMMNGAQNI
jgi:hypothetical protein